MGKLMAKRRELQELRLIITLQSMHYFSKGKLKGLKHRGSEEHVGLNNSSTIGKYSTVLKPFTSCSTISDQLMAANLILKKYYQHSKYYILILITAGFALFVLFCPQSKCITKCFVYQLCCTIIIIFFSTPTLHKDYNRSWSLHKHYPRLHKGYNSQSSERSGPRVMINGCVSFLYGHFSAAAKKALTGL